MATTLTNGKVYKFATMNSNSRPTILYSEDFLNGITIRGNTLISGGTFEVTGNANFGGNVIGDGSSQGSGFHQFQSNYFVGSTDTNVYIGLGSGAGSTPADTMIFECAGEKMRLESDGDLHVDGDVIAYSSTTSDIRLKKNIRPLSSSLATICNLDGVKFDWKYRDEKDQIGLIAQAVETQIPEAIKEKTLPHYASSSISINEDGKSSLVTNETMYKTINYNMIVPHLIESIKELKSEIDELKIKLENK